MLVNHKTKNWFTTLNEQAVLLICKTFDQPDITAPTRARCRAAREAVEYLRNVAKIDVAIGHKPRGRSILPPITNENTDASIARFNAIAEALPLACILINAGNTQVLAANNRALQLLSNNIVGKAIIDQTSNRQQLNDSLNQFSTSQSAVPGHWQLQATSANGDTTINLAVTGALFDPESPGDEQTLLITLAPQPANSDGTLTSVNATLTEIQYERQQLQRDNHALESDVIQYTKKLELRNEELDLLNQSLNDFVSIVSHDLVSPTRRIQSFATLLKNELPKEIIKGTISDCLNFLVSSAERLTQMIDGSVRLSHIRPSSDEWRKIDLDKVIDVVEADARAMDPSANFTVKHQNLHQPYADAGLVEQLMQNLLNNAVKFRRPQTPLVVDIRTTENSELNYVEIAIRDNGKGIGEHDIKRVMRPFFRGAEVENISGTGMGLAMCMRICQQHQGRLWIERSTTAENGQEAGTEIRFRLPARKPGTTV